MILAPLQFIASAANAHIKAIRQLARQSAAYKKAQHIWIEGEHLCDAYCLASQTAGAARLPQLVQVVMSQSAKAHWLARLEAMPLQGLSNKACEAMVIPDALFDSISGLASSTGIGFVLARDDARTQLNPQAYSIVLDRIQDAGNVGSILRCAAAFGVTQVLAMEGTALLWSPKVLRSAMGAHFSLQLVEGLSFDALQLAVPLLVTDVHRGESLQRLAQARELPSPCAWIFGHEGQGVSKELLEKAALRVRIDQSGQESLNVAAAAAICLYAFAACHAQA